MGGLICGLSPICENPSLVSEAAAFVCPACGQPVRAGEDYVVAREHPDQAEVALHLNGEQSSRAAERRFHVGHFRGRLDDFFYELVEPAEQRLPE